MIFVLLYKGTFLLGGNKVKVTFKDGSVKEFDNGVKVIEIIKSISSSLAKNCVAAYYNDVLVDLNRTLDFDGVIQFVTKDDKEAFEVLNHSTAHLLAQAIKRLYPNAKFGIGPAIDEGFYYDVDLGEDVISNEQLLLLEKEMVRITKQNIEMNRTEVSKIQALELFSQDEYKLELINQLPENEAITVYSQGEFSDLCRGGHIGYTKDIKFFKLLSVAGAYWRGNSDNKMLQRIYGTSWFSQADLDNYLQLVQMRKERDHRKLGKELKIFELTPEVGPGLALWLPNGFKIKRELENYTYNAEVNAGYVHVTTPVIASKKLYEISGHWSHYNENMFPLMQRDGEEFVLRPMLCPHHMMIYKSEPRSYRDLPIRIAEVGGMYRYEASGGLIGLERVRSMHLTDSHIFARHDQIEQEVESAFNLISTAILDLGLEINFIELALRDKNNKEKFHADDALWESSQSMLRNTLDRLNVEYVEAEGEAAFYGPKIDFQVKTLLGHNITLSTIQLDYLLPERFELEYINSENQKERPVVIHRGFISTFERLMAILLEQYNGAFPTWLAPTQVKIIPVSNSVHEEYTKEINLALKQAGYRVENDFREEKLSYKIREAQVSKIPYQLVIGDNEVSNKLITYRKYGSEEQITVTLDEFIELLKQDCNNKSRGRMNG